MNQLAIVIPYYKIDFFEETIQSIAQQTEKRFTLYIGNDASPNDPLLIINKYLKEDEYTYFEYKENLGGENLALQWERILENVQEEWFQILGDDDCLAQNFVEEFYNTLPEIEKKGISIIKCGFDWIDEGSNFLESNVYDYDLVSPSELFEKKYFGQIRSSLSENIYRTLVFKKKNFVKLPLAWGSDDISLLDFSGGNMIKYIRKQLVQVRVFSNSISGSSKYDYQKQLAIHELRRLIVMVYSDFFSYSFITSILESYIYNSYTHSLPYNKFVINYYLKKGKIIQWLKSVKKSYYIYIKTK